MTRRHTLSFTDDDLAGLPAEDHLSFRRLLARYGNVPEPPGIVRRPVKHDGFKPANPPPSSQRRPDGTMIVPDLMTLPRRRN